MEDKINTNNTNKTNENNINTSNNTNRKESNKKKAGGGGGGVEVLSLGEVIKVSKILDLAFKYHKKVGPKLQQHKFESA